MRIKPYVDAMKALEEGKTYTMAQLMNATSTGPASYILGDLVAIGIIEKTGADSYQLAS